MAGEHTETRKLRDKGKMHNFYTISGITRIKFKEKGLPKVIIHISNFEVIFPEIDFESL